MSFDQKKVDQKATDQKKKEIKKSQHDANRDPLSGTAGSHPVGTGLGAVTGGVVGGVGVGAAIGTVAGPIGTLAGAAAGAVVGGIAGGLAGKAIAEEVDPTVEHGYWKSTYAKRPYIEKGASYEEYGPAYQFGWESRARYPDRTFEEREAALGREWPKHKGSSTLSWDHAKHAARESWQRVTDGRSSSPKK